jgi:hypothetical protein
MECEATVAITAKATSTKGPKWTTVMVKNVRQVVNRVVETLADVPKQGEHKLNLHFTSFNVATLALGSRPRQRACKSAGQEGSPGVTFHAPGNAKECEGMNPHTPKGTPTLKVEVSVDSQIFRKRLQMVKSNWIEVILISLKSSWNLDV